MSPKTCSVCGKELIWQGIGMNTGQWVCPIHSTRGAPKK